MTKTSRRRSPIVVKSFLPIIGHRTLTSDGLPSGLQSTGRRILSRRGTVAFRGQDEFFEAMGQTHGQLPRVLDELSK